MKADILVSGFGGQGILSLGRILAHVGLAQGSYATWFPSYGAEVRGGTAHCFVRFSSDAMVSPLLEHPDIAIILNHLSLDKFGARLRPGALLIFNGDAAPSAAGHKEWETVACPMNRIALECGSIKSANIVALGVLVSCRPHLFNREAVIEVLKDVFRDQDMLTQNIKAFCKGERLLSG